MRVSPESARSAGGLADVVHHDSVELCVGGWSVTVVLRTERGSGTVLGFAVLAAVVGVTIVALPLYGAFVGRQAVSGAADAAALAAADTRAGVVSGYPCTLAQAIAEVNQTRLLSCELDGLVATVAVSRTILGIEVVVFATAGPPAFEGQIR